MATQLERTLVKNFNPSLLGEELQTLGTGISVSWDGFARQGRALFVPIAEPIVRNGTTINPGDMLLTSQQTLTAQQIIDLDAVLTAHDSTEQSQAQVREDQDVVDRDRLVVLYNLGPLSTLTPTQKEEVTQLHVRLHLRQEGARI